MRLILAIALAMLAACGHTPHRGRLVIAGGATDAENAQVYGAFLNDLPADAVIGVIPTASASPASAAQTAARTIASHAAGRRVVAFDLPSADPARAQDPALAARIRECSALWFTGGVQSRILAVFRPANGDSPAYAAARHVLARGGVIGGTSAGAAMMSDPMISGGASEDALSGNFRTDDEDSGLGIAKGMGFFPYGMTDQHFLRRGRIGRLIVALERTGTLRGFGVEENSAVSVDLSDASITFIGSGALVDISSMKREGAALRGIRVSLLQTGDRVNGINGSITPRSGASPVSSKPADDPLPTAWAAGAVERAMERLAARPDTQVELASPGFRLRFRADASTSSWTAHGATSVARAILEIDPKSAAPTQR